MSTQIFWSQTWQFLLYIGMYPLLKSAIQNNTIKILINHTLMIIQSIVYTDRCSPLQNFGWKAYNWRPGAAMTRVFVLYMANPGFIPGISE